MNRLSVSTKHCTITAAAAGPCMACQRYIDGPAHIPHVHARILCAACCPCSGGRLLSELTVDEIRQAQAPAEQGSLFG